MKMDGVSAIALVLITSFAIDRLVSGMLFLLTMLNVVRDPAAVPDAGAHLSAERWYKAWYYGLAGILATVVMSYMGGVQLLKALLPPAEGVLNASFFRFLDTVVTGLALMGGAERLSALAKGVAPEKGEAPAAPIQVTGKLTLEESGTARAAAAGR